jgi:hypothetical protein
MRVGVGLMSPGLSRIVAVAALLGLLLACDREPDQPGSDLLRHVPADTPYVFVAGKPLPDPLRERLADHYAEQLAAQRAVLAEVRERTQASPGDAPVFAGASRVFAVLDALFAEFEGRDSAERIRELGVEPVARAVLYGIGPLPAARIEIADATRLDAMLDRVGQRAGVSAARGELDGQTYRRIDLGRVDAALAISGKQLIAGLLPDALFERDLPLLLGQRPPEHSLAETADMPALIERHGFTGYGEGFVRLDELAATLQGRAGGRNAEVMRVLDAAALRLSEDCMRVADGLVAGMPRLAIGVTRADDSLVALRGVWEASPRVAAHLTRLAAPVPGLGASFDGLLALGVGLDLPRLRNIIEDLLRYVTEVGRGCDWVDSADLQAVIPQLNLALGPMTAGIKGFNLLLDDLVVDPDTLEPEVLSGGLLAAVDDPRGVFALAAMLNPALAALEVPTDGTPVELPGEPGVSQSAPPMRVAIKDKSLLLLAGAESGRLLTTLLQAVPLVPAPLLAIDYGVAELADRLGGLMERAAERLSDRGEVEAALGVRGQLDELRQQAALIERQRFSLYANEQGLVMDQVMQLRN